MNSVSKKRICHYITERNFFDHHSRIQIHKIYDELRWHYADIFGMLYEKSTKSRTPISSTRHYMVYTNPIRSVTVLTSYMGNLEPVETVSEFAFLCPVRGPQLEIRSYFISVEYDVSDSLNTYIAGRFVFRYHGNGETTIFALAEEPATTLSTPGIMVEREYLERKKINNKPGKLEITIKF